MQEFLEIEPFWAKYLPLAVASFLLSSEVLCSAEELFIAMQKPLEVELSDLESSATILLMLRDREGSWPLKDEGKGLCWPRSFVVVRPRSFGVLAPSLVRHFGGISPVSTWL